MNNSLITTSAIANVLPPLQEKLFSARLQSLKKTRPDSTTSILSRRLFSYDCFFDKASSLISPTLIFLKDSIGSYMTSDYFDPSCDGIYKSELLSLSMSHHLAQTDKDTLHNIFCMSLSEPRGLLNREIMYLEAIVAYLNNPHVTDSDVRKLIESFLVKICNSSTERDSKAARSQDKYIGKLLKTLRNRIEQSVKMSVSKIMAYNDTIVQFIENQHHLVNQLDPWLIGSSEQYIELIHTSSRSNILSATKALMATLCELPLRSKELDCAHDLLVKLVDGFSVEQNNLMLSLIELAKRLAAHESELEDALEENGGIPDEDATHMTSISSKIENAVVDIALVIDEHLNLHVPNEEEILNIVKCTISNDYLCNCSMAFMPITSTVFDSGAISVNVIKRCLSEGILSSYFARVIDDKHLTLAYNEDELYATLEVLLMIDRPDKNAMRKVLGISIIERLMTQFYYPALLDERSINLEHLGMLTNAAIEFKMLDVDDVRLIAKAGLTKIIDGIGPAFYDTLMRQSPDFIEAVSSLLLSERTSALAAPSVIRKKSFII